MKTIGLIGGLSWESTSVYYSYINRFVQKQLGGIHSAKCLIYSFDFEEIAALQRTGEWQKATGKMIEAAKCLENGGAELIVICTNTMHLMADEVQNACTVPLVHIVDCLVSDIEHLGHKKVGLLGTKFTMEQSFYRDLLMQQGIEVITPDEEERSGVHEIIFNELCKGTFNESSKSYYLSVIKKLVDNGAEGIILGCTEIPLLISQNDTNIPLFDTTFIHANKVAALSLGVLDYKG
ncbi:aspartate/glutamate racemase family protein [Bacillus luteolus]|uniref:Aspartate/glutamate racemase family protein n=1 Tax=Litchfieldia luteola TaxID=682179 RepID=A0ABR9QIN8_9BACI|nr:aspartate/glutamate racemase family protein [Cytobacillus luteolus]MBE4908380.1 aspartate/glutamate racemase family protein [Cytobacillus luteolus]MBP1943168.1 aspartate racemase [Cytobacillus luteolus]